MTVAQVQDQVVHHSANLAAVTIPLMSVWLDAPMIFTIGVSALGCLWYLILIGEKIVGWYHEWKAKHHGQH